MVVPPHQREPGQDPVHLQVRFQTRGRPTHLPQKAERDLDDMVNLRQALDKGRKPRKKYRVSNVFVDTYLHYRLPLAFASWEAAVEHAVRVMTNGREGI